MIARGRRPVLRIRPARTEPASVRISVSGRRALSGARSGPRSISARIQSCRETARWDRTRWRGRVWPEARPEDPDAIPTAASAGSSRRADCIEIAVRKFAGEGAEHGDAECVHVGRFVARFIAGEHFRRHVTDRAGDIFRRKILKPRHAHHAEIDQLERSATLENDVIRLDVAMDDAGAMQRRDSAGKLDRDIAPFFETDRWTPRDAADNSSP